MAADPKIPLPLVCQVIGLASRDELTFPLQKSSVPCANSPPESHVQDLCLLESPLTVIQSLYAPLFRELVVGFHFLSHCPHTPF